MDDILRSLGAVTETESDLQRDIIREKILDSIKFGNGNDNNGIPISVEGVPEIGLRGFRMLYDDILREVDSNQGNREQLDLAMMKLFFVEGIARQRGIKLVTSDNSGAVSGTISASSCGIPVRSRTIVTDVHRETSHKHQLPIDGSHVGGYCRNTHEAHHIELSLVKKKITYRADSGRKTFRGGDLGLNEARIHTKIAGSTENKWNIDTSCFEELNAEAKRSRRTAGITPNSPVFSHDAVDDSTTSNKRIKCEVDVQQKKENDRKRVSESCLEDRSCSSSTQLSQSPQSDLICPICGTVIEMKGLGVDPVVAMDKHIDRCLRRSSARSRRGKDANADLDTEAGPEAPLTTSESKRSTAMAMTTSDAGNDRRSAHGYDEDWMDCGSDDDTETAATRRRLNKSSLRYSNGSRDNGRKPHSSKSEDIRSTADGSYGDNISSRSPRSTAGSLNTRHHRRVSSVGGISTDDDLFEGVRNVNSKGRIQEDMVDFIDDWEDDVYLDRLVEAGVMRRVRSNSAGFDDTRMELLDRSFVSTDYGTEIESPSWETLYKYQKEGVRWLYELYDSGVGGILGDEMGLGKTAQLCVHYGALSRVFRQNHDRNGIFLIVCPATVLQHWMKELHRWSPEMRVVVMHTISKTGGELHKLGNEGVEYVLRKLHRYEATLGLTVLITYDGLRRYKDVINVIEWTAVCLDEGQKIRNPSAEISVLCKQLPSYHRIILSGTPIQNSLRELWSLFDFIYPGRLGTLPVFELEFCEPIRAGGYRNATKLQAEIAVRCAATLQRIVKPFLLRRKKDDLSVTTKLPQKTEQVLFCRLSAVQKAIYRSILGSDEVAAVLSRRTSVFRAINTLRKLCNHPALAYRKGRVVWDEPKAAKQKRKDGIASSSTGKPSQKGKSGINSAKSVDDNDDDDDDDVDDLTGRLSADELKWEDSGKLMVLSKVLPLWYNEGHKVLLFSQTQSMLNLLEVLMKEFSFRYMRLDGSTPVNKREGIIETFNKDPSVFLMILSTRTGGVGISLTAANRVVLVDPDWNPQTDAQARERAWRIGQQRDVTIYRLISRGTIEEKIYQRQIFKLLLTKRILDDPKQKALFSKSDIKELFEFLEDDEDTMDKTAVGKTGQVRGSASNTSALPREGRVDLSLSSNGKQCFAGEERESNKVAITDICGNIIERTGVVNGMVKDDGITANKEDGEISDELPDGFIPDSETYVEQKISKELLLSNKSATSLRSVHGGKYSEEGEKDAGNNRDRRLLKALFDGDALASVYDHSVVEPGGVGSCSSKSEIQTMREHANRAVDEALRHLQASAPVYSVQGNDMITVSSSSSSTSSFSQASSGSNHNEGSNYGGSNSRYVGMSQIGSNGNGNDNDIVRGASNIGVAGAGAASARMLAGLRSLNSNAASADAGRDGSQVLSGPSNGVPTSSASLRSNITRRLQDLFRSSQSTHWAQGDQGLTSDYILQHFRDLGDQYASLFKDTLRQLAELKNGKWVPRKP